MRKLSPQTILQHLAVAMEAGHFVDYRRGRYRQCALCSQCMCSFFELMSDILLDWRYVPYILIIFLSLTAAGLSVEKEEMIKEVIRKEPICSGT